MWHVWISPQSYNSLSVKPHFLWHALQWPWPVRKPFSNDHWRRWRSKPGSRIVGSTTKVELTTVADCQSSLHRLVTSTVCKSLHNIWWKGGSWATEETVAFLWQSRSHYARAALGLQFKSITSGRQVIPHVTITSCGIRLSLHGYESDFGQNLIGDHWPWRRQACALLSAILVVWVACLPSRPRVSWLDWCRPQLNSALFSFGSTVSAAGLHTSVQHHRFTGASTLQHSVL